MKKLISLILLIFVVTSSALAFTACDDDGFTDYYESGLKFRLPDYFRRLNLSEGPSIVFSTPGARVEIMFMPKYDSEGEETKYEFDFSMSVREYTEFFINLNGWECEYVYDEERDVTNFFVFWTPDQTEEYTYYYFTILRNDDCIYGVVMSCLQSDFENYEALFKQWSSYISVEN